jgi:hypothetical protein
LETSANDGNWEFYGALDAQAEVMYWGWRRRDKDSEVLAESSRRFPEFLECYHDARTNGFTGSVDEVHLE